MAAFANILGDNLITKAGQLKTIHQLNDCSYVMLYFSAHWCPPCRSFTPKLSKFYTDLKKKSAEYNTEIVFISSDKDEGAFNEYYMEMPWSAIPWSSEKKRLNLSKKFNVDGVPCLIVLNKDGNIITKDGRAKVISDPQGESFPWFPVPLSHDLGFSFASSSGEVQAGHFANKYLGLFFSAHWCGPCRKFTPLLVKFYNNRKARGLDDFEIIWLSSDQDEQSFNEYFRQMPWLAIPFGDSRIQALSERFAVDGIPALFIVNAEGVILTHEGREAIESDPEGVRFPYDKQSTSLGCNCIVS